jgi:hypothetical protein
MADHGLHYRYHPLPSPVKVQILTYKTNKWLQVLGGAESPQID